MGRAEPPADPLAALDGWVERELRPWVDGGFAVDEIKARIRGEADRQLAICLYRIADGTVEFHPMVEPRRKHFLDLSTMIGQRAHAYRQHLRDVVRLFGIKGRALVGVYLADLYLPNLSAPIFFFQKPAGARGVLIPDIDFLIQDYNLDGDGRFDDRRPFAEKRPEAIFVGSTTGDSPLTRALIDEGRNLRIAAARFFRDRPDIAFELPNICQHDSEETRAYVEALDIGGPPRSWPEQQGYRYQISLDGNGATCGRVAISLHGRSVLLKYASPNVLYYFHGLEPWRHYIPIAAHEDVLDVLTEADRFAGLHRSIADESRRFAQLHLSRVAIMTYTARLLTRYIALFGHDGAPIQPADQRVLIDSAVHFSGIGRRWIDFGAWAWEGDRAIEGLTLFPPPGVDWAALRACGVGPDGEGETALGGQFCGTRGRSRPLHGFSAWLAEGEARRFGIIQTERFADGHERTGVPAGPPIPHAAPLTAYRARLAAR